MVTFFRKSIKKIIAILFVVAIFLSFQNEAFAAVAFRAGSTSAKASGTGAVTPALPTGVAANDIVVLVASTIAGGSMSITANGSITSWTALPSTPIDVAGGEKLYVWWGRYSSGSTGPTITPGSDHAIAGTVAYTGATTSGSPVDVSAVGTETTSDTSLSFTPGISTTLDGTMVLLVSSDGTDANQAQHSSEANASLSGVTEEMDYNTNSGGGGGFELSDGAKATAGGVGTWTATLGTASSKAYISFALKPAGVVPTVTSPTASAISTSTATIAATVTALGNPAVISARGTCLGTTPAPINCSAEGGTTTGTFTQNWTGMTPGTLYYYRGYATNSTGTGYSSDGTFTTLAVPTVTSPTATSITTTGATLGANVTLLGNPASISARGTCWDTSPAPITNCLAEGGTTTGVFTHARSGMNSSTLYYYRGYATNTTGTGYSSDGTFTTASPASGTVSASPTSCTISSGASTCTVPFTWSISNATSPNLYNSTTANQYSTSASGSGISFPITNGTNTVQVRDSSTVLNSTAVTGSCTAGTTWNGSSCAVNTFTIFASSGANGSVTPTGTTTVTQGGSQLYNITPSSGYDVATLIIDGGAVATSTTYTFTNVQASHTISATFVLSPTPPTTFTIFASSGANGSVTPTGTTTVTQGNSQAYSIAPDSGYSVATLLIDDVSVATSTLYIFSNVQANHTISATFALLPVTHTITSSTGSGGSISPLGAITVADGASQIFNINPDSGFTIETLVVDSVSIATSTSYTFNTVTADHTISATFALIPPPPGSFTIVATAGAHGTVLPSGSTAVTQGASKTYTITPDSGYDVGTLLIDSLSVATSTSYTFTNVQAAHTIEATFVALPSETPIIVHRRLASIIFSGKAFPGGKVAIVQKELGTEIAVTQQDITHIAGTFQIRFTDLPDGAHSFWLIAKDPAGRASQSKFFVLDARRGDETYKDIVFPPTVDLFAGQVSRGGKAKVFGYGTPGHTIRIYLDDILSKEALAGNGGAYSFELPTGALEFGQHKVRAKQINLDGGKESDFSTTKTFFVSKLALVKADFNGDGKIDVKDWSIFLARFASRDKELRASVDLNGDGKTDISDFSIFIKTIKKK